MNCNISFQRHTIKIVLEENLNDVICEVDVDGVIHDIPWDGLGDNAEQELQSEIGTLFGDMKRGTHAAFCGSVQSTNIKLA